MLPKLDGSLAYPSGSRWTTRGGVTDTSLRVEALAQRIGEPLARLLEAVRTDPVDGARCTPCFEYIGPENQIVVRYAHSRLVLLAVRRIEDGRYWTTDQVHEAFENTVTNYGGEDALDVVRPLSRSQGTDATGAETLRKNVQGWPSDQEGVVVAFERSGHRIKIKSLEYLALHRARDDYSTESRVLTVWADGNGQQLCGALAENRATRLTRYYEDLEEIAADAEAAWTAAGRNRKKAAIAWIARTRNNIPVRGTGFSVFNAIEARSNTAGAAAEHITKAIEKVCRQQSHIEQKVIPLLGAEPPRWRPPDGNQQDTEQ